MSVMKALGLDPKHYSHVSSDDKSTTLKHKQGHVLTIAHNALSPKMQSQLKALSNIGKENQTSSQAQEAEDQNTATTPRSREDRGYGAILAKAKGGEVNSETEVIPDKGYGKIIRVGLKDGGPVPQESPGESPAMYADGTEDQPVSQSDVPQDTSSKAEAAGKHLKEAFLSNPKVKLADEYLKGMGHILSTDAPNFLKGLTGGSEQQPQQSQQTAPEQQPQQQAPQPQQPSQPPQQDPMDQALGQSQGMLQQGYQNQLAGIQQESAAKGNLGEQQANQLEENMKVQQAAKNAFQSSYQDLENERQGLMHDIQNGHIDPEKYWTGDENGDGGHSKIATGLGMILAGFNPTSNPNAAINFLKFQMEQNLKSQEKNLDAKNNLLSNNLHQFGNMRDAADMTRLQNSEILHNQMLMAASKAATPMAKAEMLQKAGQLQQSYAPLAQQFAMRQAMMKLANGTDGNNPSDTRAYEHALNYMRMLNPEQAKEMETRLVPGVGVGKVPIPTEARNQLISHQKLSDAANDTLNFAKTHSTIIPGTPDYRVGVQKSMVLQQMIREGLLGTVFRESEKPLLNKMVDENPAGLFKEISSNPKLRTILDSNMQQMNALKSQYGLPTSHAAPQQGSNQSPEAARAWANANLNGPNAAKAQQILKKLGQ